MSLGISFHYYLSFIYFMLTLENSVGVEERNPNAIELNREISLRAGVKKSHTVQSTVNKFFSSLPQVSWQ